MNDWIRVGGIPFAVVSSIYFLGAVLFSLDSYHPVAAGVGILLAKVISPIFWLVYYVLIKTIKEMEPFMCHFYAFSCAFFINTLLFVILFG